MKHDTHKNVFVPYRGIYFLYSYDLGRIEKLWDLVFVPYRGIYFLYEGEKTMVRTKIGFRPLSGNLLSLRQVIRLEEKYALVFVPYRGIYFLYPVQDNTEGGENKVFVPYRGIYFLYPASRTPLFIRVPELFCGAKFKNCFSFSISYACAAFSLILCSAAQNSFYCRENSILPIPISYNSP